MIKHCKNCQKNNSKTTCWGYLDLSSFENTTICPICGSDDLDTIDISIEDFSMICKISEDISFLEAMIELKQKDPIEFQLKMSQFKATQSQIKIVEEESNQVKCPKCNSTNIQIVPRRWSLLTGFMTNKTDRVCVNCKYKF